MKSRVSLIKCLNYESAQVLAAVRRAVGLLGTISAYIKPGSKVLVKPNLLMAKEPETGITTHPEVVRAVIRLLKEIDCKIFVGDSPSAFGKQIERVDDVYRITGMEAVCREEGVSLVKFEKRRWRGKFPLTAALDECDHLVSIPKFKTHELMLLTAAVKNLYGLIPGTYKAELHKQHFSRAGFAGILADIYQEARPALTIVDGIVAMEGDGPGTSGKLRKTGLVLAGVDCVALDTVLALIMGIKPHEVLTIKEAGERRLGISDIDAIEVLGENLKDLKIAPFELPIASLHSKLPLPVINFLSKHIRHYPIVLHKRCIRCTACVKACPMKVIGLNNNRIKIDYSGCIACFCCQETCPASAIKVRKSLLSRLIGL